MKKTEKLIANLMDYQRFNSNDKLDTAIEKVSGKQTLSAGELSGVYAGASSNTELYIKALGIISQLIDLLPEDKKQQVQLQMMRALPILMSAYSDVTSLKAKLIEIYKTFAPTDTNVDSII